MNPYPQKAWLTQYSSDYAACEGRLKLWEADKTGWDKHWVEEQQNTPEFDEKQDTLYYVVGDYEYTKQLQSGEEIVLTNQENEQSTHKIIKIDHPINSKVRKTGMMTLRRL